MEKFETVGKKIKVKCNSSRTGEVERNGVVLEYDPNRKYKQYKIEYEWNGGRRWDWVFRGRFSMANYL